MIVYLDSSVLVRAYLADEDGHQEAIALLNDPEAGLITGTWTRIEVSGALVRAARRSRRGPDEARRWLTLLDADLGPDGPITVVGAPQDQVEAAALELVRGQGIRAMHAWHLAVARLTVPELVESGEEAAFASRDAEQRRVAAALGFRSY